MITQQNIIAFIKHLYALKHNAAAPENLLQKWSAVPNNDIANQLQLLFTHWGFSQQQQDSITQSFLLSQKKNMQSKNKNYFLKKVIKPIIILAITIPLVYTVYQYFLFRNLSTLYAITNNISIRNDSNTIVASMDLQAPPKLDKISYAFVQALDNDVYERRIDSTGQICKVRKINIGAIPFSDFLFHRNLNIGYVNQNFVTDNTADYEQFKIMFGQLSMQEANALDLRYRKIIIGCIGFDPTLKGKYILSSCAFANNKLQKQFTSIIKQEVIANNRYVIIARLSDGYYYRFYGDLVENSFAKPKRIGYNPNPSMESEFLSGDILFKYIPAKKQYAMFDCNGKALHYYSVLDNQNRIWYFEQQLPPPENNSNFLEQIMDTIKNNLPNFHLDI
jgi:hypothetical protein